MAIAFVSQAPAAVARRLLTEDDAVDIWIARWLRIRRKDILARYGCDPRRVYEIWEGTRFPGSRGRALYKLQQQFPQLVTSVDLGHHRRISRATHPDQLALFD